MRYVNIRDLVSIENDNGENITIKTFNGEQLVSKEEFRKDYVAVEVKHKQEIDAVVYGQALVDVYKNVLTPHNETY